MTLTFKKASKTNSKLRLATFGPSGSGKTMSSLRIATGIGGPIALIDTERGSASKYADRFQFDVLDLPKTDIDTYVSAIKAAHGYNVLIIDSLTHAWQELLQEIDRLANAKYKGNTWSAWNEGTPKQKRLVDAILSFPGHIIATMRTKTEWTTETDNRGKTKPVRVGLAPEQGKNIEYEFDMLMEISTTHDVNIIKDRTGMYQDKIIEKPGEAFGQELVAWLNSSAPAEAKAAEDKAVGEPKSQSRSLPVDDIAEPGPDEMLFRGKIVKKTDILGAAVNTDEDLKAWFKTIVDKFDARKHYANHLDDHFNIESAVNLTYEQAFALHEHKIKGVPYPFQWAGKKAKEEKKAETKKAPDTTRPPTGTGDLSKRIDALGMASFYAYLQTETGLGHVDTDEKAAGIVKDLCDSVEAGVYSIGNDADEKEMLDTVRNLLK